MLCLDVFHHIIQALDFLFDRVDSVHTFIYGSRGQRSMWHVDTLNFTFFFHRFLSYVKQLSKKEGRERTNLCQSDYLDMDDVEIFDRPPPEFFEDLLT